MSTFFMPQVFHSIKKTFKIKKMKSQKTKRILLFL